MSWKEEGSHLDTIVTEKAVSIVSSCSLGTLFSLALSPVTFSLAFEKIIQKIVHFRVMVMLGVVFIDLIVTDGVKWIQAHTGPDVI